MADIYVNFSAMPPGYIRGTIDYDMEELVEGWGEVSGGSAGVEDAWNVDLELDTLDPAKVEQFIDAKLLPYLRSLPAPPGTELVIVYDDPEQAEQRPVE
jgi:hypothetical protein